MKRRKKKKRKRKWKKKEEEEIEEVEEENVLKDLEDPSPFPPLEYFVEEISFEGEKENVLEVLEDLLLSMEEISFEIIINQFNFIYLLSALTIGQEDEEEEEE